MAKAVRWVMPFQSIKGINYEVRIYDSYTGSVPSAWPVTLKAGEQPFVTSEDESDDFFTPVRPSTGTMQVVDVDGSLMEDIIPENNIARPVRLIKKGATAAQDIIEWQGFLSCDTYNQDYTAVAQILDLNVISVLEAMDSVELQVSDASIKSVRLAIAECLQAMSDCTFTNILIPIHDSNILNQRINTAILFEENAISKENSTIYEITSIGCKASLQRICAYMGWVVREQGTNLFFDRIGEKSNYYVYSYQSFIGSSTPVPATQNKTSMNMSALTYRGTGHVKSTSQGAKSVCVHATVTPYEINFGLPECPYGTLQNIQGYFQFQIGTDTRYLYLVYNQGTVSTLTQYFRKRYVSFNISSGLVQSMTYGTEFNSTVDNMVLKSIANLGDNAPIHLLQDDSDVQDICYGAALCRCDFEEVQTIFHNLKSALYCCFLPVYNQYLQPENRPTPVPIFTLSNNLPVLLIGGWIRLKSDLVALLNGRVQIPDESVMKIQAKLKVGDKYWNGSAFTSTETTFEMNIERDHPVYNTPAGAEEGYYMNLGTDKINGKLELTIYNVCILGEQLGDRTRSFPAEIIFKSIDIDYIVSPDATRSDRGENNYYELLHTNFKENVTIETDIATDLNNLPSASLVIDASDITKYIQQLKYYDAEGNEYSEVPERDLLGRMADYYRYARRKIELVIEHPSSTYFPICTITGYDNRKYLPMAESRDWQTDTSTLTLMETPDGDE